MLPLRTTIPSPDTYAAPGFGSEWALPDHPLPDSYVSGGDARPSRDIWVKSERIDFLDGFFTDQSDHLDPGTVSWEGQ